MLKLTREQVFTVAALVANHPNVKHVELENRTPCGLYVAITFQDVFAISGKFKSTTIDKYSLDSTGEYLREASK